MGKLWPNKVNEITISFHPKELGDLTTNAYLDIDGVYDRVPIKLVGTSLPPAIQLNLETLDMDRIYLGKVYNYEIVAMNKGKSWNFLSTQHTFTLIFYPILFHLTGSQDS